MVRSTVVVDGVSSDGELLVVVVVVVGSTSRSTLMQPVRAVVATMAIKTIGVVSVFIIMVCADWGSCPPFHVAVWTSAFSSQQAVQFSLRPACLGQDADARRMFP